MDTIINFLQSYWWILALVILIPLYKTVLRIFAGVVIVPKNRIGLITKKFVLVGKNRALPDGKIIALNGEPGYQARTLAPGLYFGFWAWQYSIDLQEFIKIDSGKIGLIIAKDGKSLNGGSILATKVESDNFQNSNLFLTNGGQRGKQTAYLTPGVYRINTYLFEITVTDAITIGRDKVGIVTTLDGNPIPAGEIAGEAIDGHKNFQDFDTFLKNGGCKGLQPQVILSGTYFINPWGVTVAEAPMTEIPIGNVGVVISYIGKEGNDITGAEFTHGNIVNRGEKGVWKDIFNPGKYPINPLTTKVEIVPTTNIVLNWANSKTEAHNLDKNLSTITVRSKDGFKFNLDVSQIIHVPSLEAPRVIARFGNMVNLISQVLEPTIGNYFRNSAQNSDVISFLGTRQERQIDAKEHINKVLTEYNVVAVDTLIGDIVPPEDLMKTLTDRKLAEEKKITYDTQKTAEVNRQGLNREAATADMQGDVIKAELSVNIEEKNAAATVKRAEGAARSVQIAAEADATKIKLTGAAEAGKILAIGEANAEAYSKQAIAMGQDNFGKLKIMEKISDGKIRITPDTLVSGENGSGNGMINALMGFTLAAESRRHSGDDGAKIN